MDYSFLPTGNVVGTSGLDEFGLISADMMGPLITFILLGLVIMIGSYIYLGLAFMKIGEKTGLSKNISGLSWVLGIGPILITYIISGTSWWFLVAISAGMLLIQLISLTLPLLGVVLLFGYTLFVITVLVLWLWKTFEAVRKPGWWALVLPGGTLLGFIFGLLSANVVANIILILTTIAHFAFIGLAAWYED